MPSIPYLPPKDKLCHLLSFSLLEELYPRHLLASVLSAHHAWEQRERKLNQVVIIYLLILWSLWAHCSLRSACDRLLASLRWSSDEPCEATPTSGALCYRRRQLGVRVLCHLFQQVCQPFAQLQTAGCFAFGLRLMGIDGTKISVADSPETRRCFRKPTEDASKTTSPFPQLLAVLLVEIGTHAIIDAIPALGSVGESRLARGVLRSIRQGMLVLLDRGFFSAAFLQDLLTRGAHVLGRLASKRLLGKRHLLRDGSCLITLSPKQYPELRAPLTVRIISYRIRPQAAELLEQVTPSHSQHGSGTTNPKVHEVHRLVTTLVDPQRYPALDLILLYHERWEVELVIDEIKEHQRIAQHPLSSKSLTGVLQEFYALLLAHYALRVLMARAALQANEDPDRISFTQAIVLLTDALRVAPVLSPSQQQHLLPKVIEDLARPDWLLPARRLRFNSRVIKRARSRFQIKRPDHVFLSADDFPSLQEHPSPCFADLVVLLI